MNKQKDKSIYNGKICPYCHRDSVYVDSKEVYSRSFGMIYLCRPCKAWVGVHKGTDNALGRLANEELREAKKEAHFYFDKLWSAKIDQGHKKSFARSKAYEWLSKQMETSRTETHIGWFDVDECKKVVELCKPYVEKLKL
jgi:glutaredoxin